MVEKMEAEVKKKKTGFTSSPQRAQSMKMTLLSAQIIRIKYVYSKSGCVVCDFLRLHAQRITGTVMVRF